MLAACLRGQSAVNSSSQSVSLPSQPICFASVVMRYRPERAALRTLEPQDGELLDEIARGEGAVARHQSASAAVEQTITASGPKSPDLQLHGGPQYR
jgi:hypothetical protein